MGRFGKIQAAAERRDPRAASDSMFVVIDDMAELESSKVQLILRACVYHRLA